MTGKCGCWSVEGCVRNHWAIRENVGEVFLGNRGIDIISVYLAAASKCAGQNLSVKLDRLGTLHCPCPVEHNHSLITTFVSYL